VRELERQARELRELERELDERARAQAAAPPEPEPQLVVTPARGRAPQRRAAAATPAGAFTIDQLERLVAQHAARAPDRGEEWRAYLVFLRDFARSDGALPPSFDSLVHEVFGSLLKR
jgi:hypothetical protein